MHIIARRTLVEFTKRYPESKGALDAWWAEAKHARWRSPADIKQRYPSASVLGDNRIVFNIGGNKYRLIVKFNYDSGTGFVRFLGTHAAYDRIDGETI